MTIQTTWRQTAGAVETPQAGADEGCGPAGGGGGGGGGGGAGGGGGGAGGGGGSGGRRGRRRRARGCHGPRRRDADKGEPRRGHPSFAARQHRRPRAARDEGERDRGLAGRQGGHV